MARIKHGTLTANNVSTVTVDAFTSQITIVCRTLSAEIFYTVDGSTPTVGGDDNYLCLGSRVVPTPTYTSPTTVKLISTSNPNYSVIGEST
jgi:hypothetical protein